MSGVSWQKIPLVLVRSKELDDPRVSSRRRGRPWKIYLESSVDFLSIARHDRERLAECLQYLAENSSIVIEFVAVAGERNELIGLGEYSAEVGRALILTFAAASFLVDWKIQYYCLWAVLGAAAAVVVAAVVVAAVGAGHLHDFGRQLCMSESLAMLFRRSLCRGGPLANLNCEMNARQWGWSIFWVDSGGIYQLVYSDCLWIEMVRFASLNILRSTVCSQLWISLFSNTLLTSNLLDVGLYVFMVLCLKQASVEKRGRAISMDRLLWPHLTWQTRGLPLALPLPVPT